MRREASIPLFLWVASAALAHLMWGGGAEQGARLIDERLDVGRFAAGIRSHVRGSIAPPLEIAIEDESAIEDEPKPDEPKEDPKDDDEQDEQVEPDKVDKATPDPPAPTPKLKEEEKKLPPEPAKPEEPKKVEPAKPEPAKPEEPAKVVQQLELPKRIAVKQHVDDEKQKQNPDAKYVSDKANRVAEETRARITSTDQDEKKPSPGKAPSGPTEEPGNGEETHVRQDDDVKGEKDVTPGGSQTERAARATAALPVEQLGKAGAAAPGKVGTQQQAPTPSERAAQNKNQEAKAATQETPGVPEVVASQSGTFSMGRPQAATPEQKAQKAKKRLPPRRPRSLAEAIGGLGAAGRTPGGVALNLTPNMAAEAIGSDELSRLRRSDGERRRSAHRGSWRAPGLERYRSAIENYVAAVKPGNQTALNTAAVPFALYLNQIHARIHPLFADQFLSHLDALPSSHPMNDPNLITSLEIVVEREEGRLVRRGVTRTSGVTMFDVSAIDAVERAGPFGTPPAEIVSPDGNVYLHWEFRRDAMACSTLFAHPFILNVPPKPAPLPGGAPLPPFRGPDDEKPPEGERHGLLAPEAEPPPAAPEG